MPRWDNPLLTLSRWEGNSAYIVSLHTYLEDGSRIGIPWSLSVREARGEVSPDWLFRDENHPLRATPSYERFLDLERYVYSKGADDLARKLLQFAEIVIKTPGQPPQITWHSNSVD